MGLCQDHGKFFGGLLLKARTLWFGDSSWRNALPSGSKDPNNGVLGPNYH